MALLEIEKEKIQRILSATLSYFAEIAVYADNWSTEFKIERLDKIYAELRVALKGLHLDVNDMTKEELQLLGCQAMKSGLMLLPLYLYDVLPEGTELISVLGNKCVVGVDYIDNDNRGGMLAYGVYPKEAD